MSVGLQSSFARLERALAHYDALGASIKAFSKRKTYDLRFDQRGDRLAVVCIEIEPVPQEWPLLLSDFMHNLRSALENAVWALSVRNVGLAGVVRPEAVHFPIHRDEHDFDRAAVKALAHLTADERAIVKRLQPFNADPGTPDPHPLLLLHDLNRIDKHRELNVVLQALAGYHLAVTPHHPDTRVERTDVVKLEHGAVLAMVDIPPALRSRYVDVEHQIAYEVALAESGVTPRLPLDEAALAMYHWTVGAVAQLDPG